MRRGWSATSNSCSTLASSWPQAAGRWPAENRGRAIEAAGRVVRRARARDAPPVPRRRSTCSASTRRVDSQRSPSARRRHAPSAPRDQGAAMQAAKATRMRVRCAHAHAKRGGRLQYGAICVSTCSKLSPHPEIRHAVAQLQFFQPP
eukprot:2708463-Pleurochrysis_carterae.AAC.3